MKLWKLSQDHIDGYDTYDSAVVAADTHASARMIHPSLFHVERIPYTSSLVKNWNGKSTGDWPDVERVKVQYLGEADPTIEKGVICASFNAG